MSPTRPMARTRCSPESSQDLPVGINPFQRCCGGSILNHPVERQVVWRMIGDRPAEPVVPSDTVRDGMRRIEFEQRALPEAVGSRRCSPSSSPCDFFSFRSSRAGPTSPTGQTRYSPPFRSVAIFRKWLKNPHVESDPARVTAALEFVQTDIRYFSVSMGKTRTGRLRPTKSSSAGMALQGQIVSAGCPAARARNSKQTRVAADRTSKRA